MSSQPASPTPRSPGTSAGGWGKAVARVALALLFVGMGVAHFLKPVVFAKVVPPYLPFPLVLVYVSGFFEILGGVGLLIPRLRRAAGWGLLALLIAVFPANVYMAQADVRPLALDIPTWVLWARLPFQVVLIGWAYWCTREG